ncbi:isocitrate lyase/phosphoenolpyruvate mutase family protein [Streptomyces eurythermus]|uniref:isocitrate lyase/phosphoenolpyruvate mutase family protein n=1 Tax=Streptomyces eurythermus TaxID=42237 RepID=UPI0036F81324
MTMKAARLRELLERGRIARIMGARDGLTARLVEDAGFDGVWASSFELSATRGLPDLGLLTMSECLTAAAQIDEATSLPVLADCDTGFGGRANLVRTVQRFERAGIAGVAFEDKVFPKRNSFLEGGQDLEDAEEFAARLEAASQARVDGDFTIVARTEALIAGAGMDEALRRAHLYADAHADAILIHSKRSDAQEIEEFLRRWQRRKPVVVVPTTYPHWSLDQAATAGVSMVVHANHALRAAVTAMREVLAEIALRGGTSTVEGDIASMKELFELTGVSHWERLGG